MGHHQIPLRATSQQREDEGAEEDQSAQRWHDSEQSTRVFFGNADALVPLQSPVKAVGGEQATQHNKGIGVQGGCPSNNRPRLAQRIRHLCSIGVRLEEQSHRLVGDNQHDRIDQANSVDTGNVTALALQA